VKGAIGPNIAAWMKRIEALPYYDKTYPPHWKRSHEGRVGMMELAPGGIKGKQTQYFSETLKAI